MIYKTLHKIKQLHHDDKLSQDQFDILISYDRLDVLKWAFYRNTNTLHFSRDNLLYYSLDDIINPGPKCKKWLYSKWRTLYRYGTIISTPVILPLRCTVVLVMLPFMILCYHGGCFGDKRKDDCF